MKHLWLRPGTRGSHGISRSGQPTREAPPGLMLAQMTYMRGDHAVLQAGGAHDAMTEYNAFAQLHSTRGSLLR
jgi:hypothetical protein